MFRNSLLLQQQMLARQKVSTHLAQSLAQTAKRQSQQKSQMMMSKSEFSSAFMR